MWNKPLACFITFTTYGTWLHGDGRGSITVKDHATKPVTPSGKLHQSVQSQLNHPPVTLHEEQRRIVLETIRQHCFLKQWNLWAAHVRSNHVHFLVQTEQPADKVLKDIKAWCTRRLRESGFDIPKVWTRHGSTKYVFTYEKLLEKIHYVVFEQGRPMAYYLHERFQGRWES